MSARCNSLFSEKSMKKGKFFHSLGDNLSPSLNEGSSETVESYFNQTVGIRKGLEALA
jgi:hypothetical protein